MNLWNPLSTNEKARKWGIHPGFETQDRCHQKSKVGVTVAPQKRLVSCVFFKRYFYCGKNQGVFVLPRRKFQSLNARFHFYTLRRDKFPQMNVWNLKRNKNDQIRRVFNSNVTQMRKTPLFSKRTAWYSVVLLSEFYTDVLVIKTNDRNLDLSNQIITL